MASVHLFPNVALKLRTALRGGSAPSDHLSEAKSKEKDRLEAERHEHEESAKVQDRRALELDDVFWDGFLDRVEAGEIIPVVGPGAVTFGDGDELLYPWLAGKLAAELTPRLQFGNPPCDLEAVVDEQRRAGQPIDRIYRHLYRIVEDGNLRPGPTLAALAALEANLKAR